MTVPSTKNVKTHVGNGVTTVFPFDFRIFEAEDLEVSLTLADGTIEEWVLGTDFTVPAKWEDVQAGGEIIATTAPASGTTLVIKRVLDLLQQTDLRNQGDFLAEVIEDQFDRFAMQDQQLAEVQGRTLQRPLSGGGWNALGYPIKNLGAPVDPNDAVRKSDLSAFATGVIQPLVDEAEDYRDQSVQSAGQAANSATTASNAATTATDKLAEFQGQYYGAYASDPTEDPNGNPPGEGDLYWNTTAKQWRVWNGTAWQQPDTAVPVNYDRRDYIATAGQTVFEVAYDAPFVQVWVNGLLLPPEDYAASTGTEVVLNEGVVAGTEVTVVGLGSVVVGALDGDNAVVTTLTGTQLLPDALNDRVIQRPDLPALRALTGMQEGQAAQITTTVRAGLFRWDGSDLSAEVSSDPYMGRYVPPEGQDGSQGAWVQAQGGAEKFLTKDRVLVSIGDTGVFHQIAGEDQGVVDGYEVVGGGVEVGESYGVRALNGVGSARNNVVKNMRFRDISGAAVMWTGGWNNLLFNNWMSPCHTGIKSEVNSALSGWAFSGLLSVNNYIAGSTTDGSGAGIDNTAAWCFTSINDVIEHGDTPLRQSSSGRADVYINTWIEGNDNPPIFRRPSVVIGGRGWEFSDVSLFNNARHLVRLGVGDLTGIIGNNGYTFSVDGVAVQNFVPSLTGVGFAIEDNLGATAKQVRYQIGGGTDVRHNGEVTGGFIPLNVMRGSAYRWSENPAAMEGARVEIQGTASNAASGSGANRVAIYTEHVTEDESIVDSGYRWYFEHRGHLTPATDNAYDIGSASFRPREIFAAQGTINTSDKRLKTDPDAAALDAAVAAWASVRAHAWKWLQSVEDKGEQARIHIGPFAQDIIAAFDAQGLDPFDYGLLCSDPVFELVETEQTITRTRQVTKFREENGETLDYREDEEYEDIVIAQEQVPVLDENGKQEVVYSLRPTECLFLEMEYSRRRFAAIEDRLDAAGI